MTPFDDFGLAVRSLRRTTEEQFHRLATTNFANLKLVQIALLLSRGSPYNLDSDIYWLDQAFHHAQAARLSENLGPYHRVTWWCCIFRNRVLALARHHPRRLQDHDPGLMLTLDDFGVISILARTSLLSGWKRRLMELFIASCELSGFMNDILLLRCQTLHTGNWQTSYFRTRLYEQEIERVFDIESRLEKWRSERDGIFTMLPEESSGKSANVAIRMVHLLFWWANS